MQIHELNRQLGINASSVQRHAMAKPPLVLDHNTRVRVGRHLPPGNTARPDRYEQSFMAIGSLIYGDKKCALSTLYANWLKAWKEREGCCPSHLLLPVRVRIDGTSPHLPPLTERMNEERSLIYTWDQSHERYAIHNSQYSTSSHSPPPPPV